MIDNPRGEFRSYTVEQVYEVYREIARTLGCFERNIEIQHADNKPRKAVLTFNIKIVGERGF